MIRRLFDFLLKNPQNQSITTGPITGENIAIGKGARAGKFFNVFILQELSEFVTRHKRGIGLLCVIGLISLVLQGVLFAIWNFYADRFLISTNALLTGMALLEACIIFSVTGFRRRLLRLWLVAALTGILFCVVVGLQTYISLFPTPYNKNSFIVAVAAFGESQNFTNTGKAESDTAYVRKLFDDTTSPAQANVVQYHPIGLIRNNNEAWEDGLRINADVVLWGYIDTSGGKTILNITVLETPDRVSNPNFPRVIPRSDLDPGLNGFIPIDSGQLELGEGVKGISELTVGLKAFEEWDFVSAQNAFRNAISNLDALPKGANSNSNDPLQQVRYLLHIYYGLSLQWPGELDDANKQFSIAAGISQGDPAPHLAMAFDYRSLGQMDQAKAEAEKAIDGYSTLIKTQPDQIETVYYDRAMAYEVLKDWKDARSDYMFATDRNPNFVLAHIGAVRMNLTLGDTAQAIATAQTAIRFAEQAGANAGWGYIYLAAAQQQAKHKQETLDAIQKAITLTPNIDWIRFEAGQLYEAVGDPNSAETQYKAMTMISPNTAWPHTILGKLYMGKRDWKDAITEFGQALAPDRSATLILIDLADAQFGALKIDDAGQTYQSAVDSAPDNFFAHAKFGEFLYSSGRVDESIAQFEAAHGLNPNDCGVMQSLSLAYTFVHDSDSADNIQAEAAAAKCT